MTTVQHPKARTAPLFKKWGPLLFLIFGYSTLNRGFSYIGTYPVFIGEFTIILYMLTIRHSVVFPKFWATLGGKFTVIFFLYSAIRFAFAATVDLSESIRNSIYWIYPIFFYFGFVFGRWAVRRNLVPSVERYFASLSIAILLYYSLFPFRMEIREATAFLTRGNSLVGYYSTLHALALGFSFYPIFYGTGRRMLAPIAGIFLVIGVSQARAAILALLGMIIFIFMFQKNIRIASATGKLFFVFIIIATVFVALDVNIEVPGQRGTISSRFMVEMVSSIFFDTNNESLEGSRSDRLEWWQDVVERTSSSPITMFFGLGVNEILVDREVSVGVPIRYPHNSFVSVFGFSGLVGVTLFVATIIAVFRTVIRARKLEISTLILWYPVFAIGFLMSATFSTVFEAPFHSATFWTISGTVYAIALRGRAHATKRMMQAK